QMGIQDSGAVEPPMSAEPRNPFRYAWLEFSCKSLTDSYHEMSRYARGLRKDILVECNPGGVGGAISPPVDHAGLLQGGEAFWDEGRHPGYRGGNLATRIRTYKLARRMDNIAFAYSTTPLEMAESMAFNLDCLGCICWFEYNDLVAKPGVDTPVSLELAPYIDFFHKRRDLLRDASVIADVAVLRSFPSQAFADPKHAQLTAQIEQDFIENRIPFQIIYDRHLDELQRYQCLVLAGCVALSDEQVALIQRYVDSGGRVCIVGPVATHDEWMAPRKESPFAGIRSENVTRTSPRDDVVATIRKVCDDRLSVSIQAPVGLCAELTEQNGRRFVHLVNYRFDGPVSNVAVRLRLPAGKGVEKVTLANPLRENDVVLNFDEENDFATFTVPEVSVYEIAQVVLK
ncbi:MAG: hypothetical protein ABIH23_31675, partial [bacterium]